MWPIRVEWAGAIAVGAGGVVSKLMGWGFIEALVIAAVIYLVICPPQYDPAIWIVEWLTRKRKD